MFARFRKWLRGRKRSASISTKPKSQRRDTLRKTKSVHDIEMLREDDENDGFKKNVFDDFDIVLSTEVHRENNNYVSPNVSSPLPDSTDVGGQSHKESTTSKQEETDDTIPQRDNESKSGFNKTDNESLDGSVVDLVHQPPTSNEQSPTQELDFSYDEMEALNMFDSMVHDIETEGNEGQPEKVSLPDNESRIIPDDNHSMRDDELADSAQQTVDERTKSPVDFDRAFGERSAESSNTGVVDNWRVMRTESVRKSLRFIENTGMYLPPAPELPAADYPDTDDDLRQGDIDLKDDLSILGTTPPSNPPTYSLPRVQLPSPTQRPNGEVKNTETPRPEPNISEVEIVNHKVYSNTLPNPTTNTTGDPEFSNTATALPNGKGSSNSIAVSSKKPKPRVTSFKSSGTPPKVANSQNFTKLVEKFERL